MGGWLAAHSKDEAPVMPCHQETGIVGVLDIDTHVDPII